MEKNHSRSRDRPRERRRTPASLADTPRPVCRFQDAAPAIVIRAASAASGLDQTATNHTLRLDDAVVRRWIASIRTACILAAFWSLVLPPGGSAGGLFCRRCEAYLNRRLRVVRITR